MTNSDKDFINTFNSYYPFERYIIKNPQKINYLFDDALLTELFIPNTEIKPILNNGKISYWTKINNDEIYIKVKGTAGEMRFAYFDFDESVRETIRGIIYEDFGQYEWQSLYVEYEDKDDYEFLKEELLNQKSLITDKYGVCNVKENFDITDTLNLLKE